MPLVSFNCSIGKLIAICPLETWWQTFDINDKRLIFLVHINHKRSIFLVQVNIIVMKINRKVTLTFKIEAF